MPPPPKNSPYRLIVEGPDDQHAVTHLMKRHGFDWDDAARTRPFIESAGGIRELLDSTKRSTDAKSYSRLGLVLDADLKSRINRERAAVGWHSRTTRRGASTRGSHGKRTPDCLSVRR